VRVGDQSFRVGSNKFSRCSCCGGGGCAALTRLSQIITAPAANNTTAMTNQIMVRPPDGDDPRAVCKRRPDSFTRQLTWKTRSGLRRDGPAAAETSVSPDGRAGTAVVDTTGG